MGVYLPNMEMPTKGYRLILVHADGTAQTTDGEATTISIPPHGDLIDRDALLDTATIHWSQTTNESCFPIDEIEYAPIVIPAEEGE